MSTKRNHSLSNPETLYDPTPNGYSHIAVVKPKRPLVFVAGQGGEDKDGNYAPDFRSQVRQAFENLRLALQSERCEMKSIIKLTTLIVDYDATKHQILFEESNRHWPDKNFPPQTLIPAPKLAFKEMLFEVEAIAVK